METMDARKLAVNAIVRVLVRANMNVPATTKIEMLYALQKYIIIREEPVKGDIQSQINHFLTGKEIDGLSPKTLREYRYQLQSFAGHIERYPNRIKTDDIRNYISYLNNDRHLKPSSIITAINTLKSFFSWMQTEEVIKKNPITKINPLKLDKKSLRHNLSAEEVELMRNACVTDREKAMFELFYSSGCRLSELAGINVSDIDFHERSLDVLGKGSKTRTVYFSVRAKLCIEQYLKNRNGNCEALFIGYRKPHSRLKTRAIQREIQHIGERTSIKARVFPHILRHTFATHALNSGMELGAIQKLMGHDNPNTTQIYAEISRSVVKNNYDRLSF